MQLGDDRARRYFSKLRTGQRQPFAQSDASRKALRMRGEDLRLWRASK